MIDKHNYFTYTDNTSDDNDKTMKNLHKERECDEFKKANDANLTALSILAKNNIKLRETLAEIKEIAENGKRFAERYMITGEQKANVLTYANAILQKISEVEDDK